MLRKLFLWYNPDKLLVVNNGYPAGDSCRAATIAWGFLRDKTRSIHNFHGIALKPGLHIRLQEYIVDTFMARCAAKFISVSRAAAQSMSCRTPIFRRHNIAHIYNGITFAVALTDFPADDLKKELGISQDSRICLMLGAYHYNKNFNKGHRFLFNAFRKVVKQMPNAHLFVCGYGSEDAIEDIRRIAYIEGLGQNIHLSNFRTDIPFILRQTDVVLVASQAFESFCLVSIEAMANKVPVVATDVGAIPEIVVNGQGGYCVQKDDIDGYAGYVIELLKDEQLRREQGEIGFRRYNDFFTARRMAGEYAKIMHYG